LFSWLVGLIFIISLLMFFLSELFFNQCVALRGSYAAAFVAASFSIVDKTNEAENCLQIKVHDAK